VDGLEGAFEGNGWPRLIIWNWSGLPPVQTVPSSTRSRKCRPQKEPDFLGQQAGVSKRARHPSRRRPRGGSRFPAVRGLDERSGRRASKRFRRGADVRREGKSG